MAEEKIFLVEGEFESRGKKQRFSKRVKAKSPKFAAEKVMCLFGSKNKIRRNKIIINEAKEVVADAERKKN